MHYGVLLTIYCLLLIAASLAGGWLPRLLRLTHTGMQLAMSFVGGAMLGVGLLHLLPHAFYELHDIQRCVYWLLGGFLTMFFIERVFHFHHHDAPPDPHQHTAPAEKHDHGHTGHSHAGHSHATHAPGAHGHGSERPRTWTAALAGLALHSATDGMALAASVTAEAELGAWGGLAVFLVVFLHKPFDSLTLGTLMAVSGESSRTQHIVNGLYALALPVGVGMFLLGVGASPDPEQSIIGPALAFSAGTFLCISTSDLLPELQFHAHDRLKLSAALLLGLAASAVLVMIESSVHTHNHGHESSINHVDDGHDHAH